MHISTLKLGDFVQVKHFQTWYRARVYSIGRTRVSVVFFLHQGRGERRRDVRAAELRPVPEDRKEP